MLDSKGVTTVDTTCPWVSKVWTTVDKHERADMTSVIHGKYAHEEAIATASMAETYLIIKNMAEAQEVASYILTLTLTLTRTLTLTLTLTPTLTPTPTLACRRRYSSGCPSCVGYCSRMPHHTGLEPLGQQTIPGMSAMCYVLRTRASLALDPGLDLALDPALDPALGPALGRLGCCVPATKAGLSRLMRQRTTFGIIPGGSEEVVSRR